MLIMLHIRTLSIEKKIMLHHGLKHNNAGLNVTFFSPSYLVSWIGSTTRQFSFLRFVFRAMINGTNAISIIAGEASFNDDEWWKKFFVAQFTFVLHPLTGVFQRFFSSRLVEGKTLRQELEGIRGLRRLTWTMFLPLINSKLSLPSPFKFG